MEFVLEFLLEVFLEAPMESKRLKTWVKTAMFLVFTNFLTLVMILSTVDVWKDQHSIPGTIFMSLLTFAWFAATIWMAVRGHKHKWKQ